MNNVKSEKITYRTLITTFDKEFSLDINSCLMFMETTGLNANKSKLTLLSLAYNEDGSGKIIQVFNNDGDEESTLLEALSYIEKFELIQISNYWFQKYLEGKLKYYNQHIKLCFNDIDVAMKHFYKEYKPGFDVNDAAIKSIQIYKEAIKRSDKSQIEDYLAYNRNHALAYQDWVDRSNRMFHLMF